MQMTFFLGVLVGALLGATATLYLLRRAEQGHQDGDDEQPGEFSPPVLVQRKSTLTNRSVTE